MIAETNFGPRLHTFIIENESTQETTIIKQGIIIVDNGANLRSVVGQIPDYPNKIFKIYDFSQNRYCPIKEFNIYESGYCVPASFMHSEIILIKFSKDSMEIGSVKSSVRSISDTTSVKK